MSEPVILFGLGATKAGTTWLYRMLSDHPDCALRSVKELHYFSSDAPQQTRQRLRVCQRALDGYGARLVRAAAAGDTRACDNLARQIRDTEELMQVLGAERTGDAAYRAYLMDGAAGHAVTGDITPAYASLPEATLARMAMLGTGTRFIYLVRDPLGRLWSHVRMMADRVLQAGEDFSAAANRLLAAVLRDGAEAAVLDRADYAGAVARMRRALPADRLLVLFSEETLGQAGFDRICAWLGIARREVPLAQRVHKGRMADMDGGLVAEALARLAPQYEWAAREMGPLPDAWRASMQRIPA